MDTGRLSIPNWQIHITYSKLLNLIKHDHTALINFNHHLLSVWQSFFSISQYSVQENSRNITQISLEIGQSGAKNYRLIELLLHRINKF